jgi:hypothetical protein
MFFLGTTTSELPAVDSPPPVDDVSLTREFLTLVPLLLEIFGEVFVLFRDFPANPSRELFSGDGGVGADERLCDNV